jgi:hypothetical protein
MFPALLLAAALIVTPEHRVADVRTGATTAGEAVLAVDGDRLITYRRQEATLRAVSIEDPAQATTLVTDVTTPVAAPPLIAWTSGDRIAHVAPIDAPDRATALPQAIRSMQCNAKACLAGTDGPLLLLGRDARLLAQVPVSGLVLAADPDGFLVRRGADGALLRVDAGGAIAFTTAPTSLPFFIAADFDGDRYAVVYADAGVLRVVSVTRSGDVGQPVTLTDLPAIPEIAIAHVAGRHLVVFDYPDSMTSVVAPLVVGRARLHALRLDDALQPLDAAPFIVDDTPFAAVTPVVVARDGGFFVGWNHAPGVIYVPDPEGATVDADGRVSPRTILSRGPVPQTVSSAASVPGALLIAYAEWPHEAGAPLLRLRELATNGAPLGDPITIAEGSRSTMAARGHDVLIAWQTTTLEVAASVLHADGSLQRVTLPSLRGMPSVAASRSGWMIVAAESDTVTTIAVDANGMASPPRTLVSVKNAIISAAVASDGERFLVVWAPDINGALPECNFAPCGTRAELVDATGGVLVSGIPISGDHDEPAVAFAGGEYLAVSPTAGVRIDRDGARIGSADAHGIHGTRLVPFGNAVLLAEPGIHLSVIDHGVRTAEADIGPVNDSLIALAPTGIAYDVAGEPAVGFRQFVVERRRSAYH